MDVRSLRTVFSLGVIMCCRTTEIIEATRNKYGSSDENSRWMVPNIKPLVRFLVNGMVLVAQFLWCDSFLQGLSFGGRAVFICSTDVDGSPVS